MVPAPALREVAEIWWDVDRDPLVVWDERGRRFDLVDPQAPARHRLVLARFAGPVTDPARVARVLAEGLAACDFPPTGTGASPSRVRATLRVAGLADGPLDVGG